MNVVSLTPGGTCTSPPRFSPGWARTALFPLVLISLVVRMCGFPVSRRVTLFRVVSPITVPFFCVLPSRMLFLRVPGYWSWTSPFWRRRSMLARLKIFGPADMTRRIVLLRLLSGGRWVSAALRTSSSNIVVPNQRTLRCGETSPGLLPTLRNDWRWPLVFGWTIPVGTATAGCARFRGC